MWHLPYRRELQSGMYNITTMMTGVHPSAYMNHAGSHMGDENTFHQQSMLHTALIEWFSLVLQFLRSLVLLSFHPRFFAHLLTLIFLSLKSTMILSRWNSQSPTAHRHVVWRRAEVLSRTNWRSQCVPRNRLLQTSKAPK